jgi:hypothetical protein
VVARNVNVSGQLRCAPGEPGKARRFAYSLGGFVELRLRFR